jgi:hypothetical protein
VENVIIKFGSFEARERLIGALMSYIKHIYKRDPWVSAIISDEIKATLMREDGIKIVRDSTLSPM